MVHGGHIFHFSIRLEKMFRGVDPKTVHAYTFEPEGVDLVYFLRDFGLLLELGRSIVSKLNLILR